MYSDTSYNDIELQELDVTEYSSRYHEKLSKILSKLNIEKIMDKKLILIELNEINFDVVEFYLANGVNLDGFKTLFDKVIVTKSEQEYDNLEPWIQWPSVHNGKTFFEHKIFRLGDSVYSSDEQIFEKIEKAGFSVGAISPMNATNKLKEPAYFIPDPWTQTQSDNSFLAGL